MPFSEVRGGNESSHSRNVVICSESESNQVHKPKNHTTDIMKLYTPSYYGHDKALWTDFLHVSLKYIP